MKKFRDKFSLSEAQLGYLMIAPSVIIICVMALYPVLRSFYYSLFDLRLNNPTKNETNFSYKLDLERYYNNYDIVAGALKRASTEATLDVKPQLQKDYEDLQAVDASIEKEPEVAKRTAQVKAYTQNMLAVTDDKIKFAILSKDSAQKLINIFGPMIESLSKLDGGKNAKVDISKAAGLMQELKDSVISPNFVGFENYSYYFKDKDFLSATAYTFLFTIISVSCELVLGLMIALIINKPFKGRGLVRTAVLVPWAIPTVVSAMMWRFLYDGQNGFVSMFMQKLHLISNMAVLATTHVGATFAIIFADVWKTTPYMALLLLAGLQGIDESIYEATCVDGASKVQQFFKITLPLIKPTILVALLFRTLDAFRIFDLVYVLTGGGHGTDTITTYAYKTMFAQMDFGRGSAISVIVFLCITLISIGYIKVLGANVMNEY